MSDEGGDAFHGVGVPENDLALLERETQAAPGALAGTTAVFFEVPAKPSRISRKTGS